jgi:small-conductance mechanosensitive channel
MGQYHVEIFQTLAVVLLLVIVKLLLRALVINLLGKLHLAPERRRIITKINNILLFLVAFVLLTAIWGVDSDQVTVYITSALTILGVGFFAQWSILSNLTSSMILFFNHPVRIGGRIKILDKDYPIEGVVENISLFFMYIRTENHGLVTIPNVLVLQKTIALESENKIE